MSSIRTFHFFGVEQNACYVTSCCVSYLYILLVMVAALQTSADLVCCSLLLKSYVVGTLNRCVFYVHYGSTVWIYTM